MKAIMDPSRGQRQSRLHSTYCVVDGTKYKWRRWESGRTDGEGKGAGLLGPNFLLEAVSSRTGVRPEFPGCGVWVGQSLTL